MGILEGMASGFFQAISLGVLPYLVIGALFGLIVGVIPGLSGHFAMAMVIPFLYTMEPATGVAFLLGAHSTVSQGGGLTAILFNIPGTGSNVATMFDGSVMRANGRGGVAVGVAMTSCFLGAAFGALVIALLLPALRHIVLLFGPPEVFVLVLLALTFVSVLGDGDIIKSIVAALSGLLLAMIGLDNVTNQERFTFGLLSLQDGLELVPVILGLFAVSEMFELWSKGGSLIGKHENSLSARETQKQIFHGVSEAFRHWWLVMRCSSIGTVLGLVPGLGSAAASFIAYAHAKQTSKSRETFGKGNIEGVIAPESAIDAVEGGALATTLAFGIPGSSSMAILLAGLFVLGLETGPKMVTDNVDLVFVMIFTIVIGNFIGTVAGMFMINPLTRASTIRSSILVPVLITTIFTGAYAVNFSWFDIGIAVVFGILGYLMKEQGYSRAALLIGFVLGFALEKNLYLAVQLSGPYFIFDTVPLTLAIITIVFLGYSIWNIIRENKKGEILADGEGVTAVSIHEGTMQLCFIAVIGLILVAAFIQALTYDIVSARTPLVIMVPLLILAGVEFRHSWKVAAGTDIARQLFDVLQGKNSNFNSSAGFFGWMILLLALIFVAGHYAGIAAFMFMLMYMIAGEKPVLSLSISGGVTLIIYTLFEHIFSIELYRGLVYRAWAGYGIY